MISKIYSPFFKATSGKLLCTNVFSYLQNYDNIPSVSMTMGCFHSSIYIFRAHTKPRPILLQTASKLCQKLYLEIL